MTAVGLNCQVEQCLVTSTRLTFEEFGGSEASDETAENLVYAACFMF